MAKGHRSRKTGNRKEYATVLIVCEGQKTERIYFNRYKERKSGLRIETQNSNITDPANLVKFALRQIEKYDLDLDNGDQVWCVFDTDRNTDENIRKAESLAGTKVKLCLSNPCFEIWYLIHFGYFNNTISTAELQRKLKTYIKDYEKTKDCFNLLLAKRDDAIKYAKKLNQEHQTAKTKLLSTKSNPSTQVVQLVEYILEVIRKNKR